MNIEKGITSSLVGLVLVVLVLGGVVAILFKGSSTANPLSILPCIFTGGKDCGQVETRTQEDVAGSLRSAIRCAYDRCVKGCVEELRTITWNNDGVNCYDNFCVPFAKDLKGEKLCGENSEKNPVVFRTLESAANFIPVNAESPITLSNDKIDTIVIDDSCIDGGQEAYPVLRIERNLLKDEKNQCNSCKTKDTPQCLPQAKAQRMEQCQIKSTFDLGNEEKAFYLFHREDTTFHLPFSKVGHHIVLCSHRPKGGPLTIFEHEKSGGKFVDMSKDSFDIGELKNKVSSLALTSNYRVVFYDNKDHKGDCRTFYANVDNINDYDFNDKTESIKLYKDLGLGGAILNSEPIESGNLEKRANEFFPATGTKYYLSTGFTKNDCVFEKVRSVNLTENTLAALYEKDTILYIMFKSGNLPIDVWDKATHVKICPRDSSQCLTSEEDSFMKKLQAQGQTNN